MNPFIIGTRGSDLALWQANHVGRLLGSYELRIITTRGDVDLSERLAGKLEKGFFTQELEDALRQSQIDLAVHSLKDLPTQNPPGLHVPACLERADANDLLLCLPEVVDDGSGPERLPLKASTAVGASSLRRDALLRHFAPGASGVPLRGNVPTRIQKLRRGEPRAIVLAAAGVQRLGLDLSGLRVFALNPTRWLPAPGQGSVAAQCRDGDTRTEGALGAIAHPATALAVRWERAFLSAVEGGCTTPLGAYALGDACFLGLASSSGAWQARKLTLPAGGPEQNHSFIHAALQDLKGESEHVWLYREVK